MKNTRAWRKRISPNNGAFVICGIYSVIAVPLLALALFERDIKSAVILQQIALIPLTLLAGIPRIYQFFGDNPWLDNMYVGFAVSLTMVYVAAYVVCWSLISLFRLVAARWRT